MQTVRTRSALNGGGAGARLLGAFSRRPFALSLALACAFVLLLGILIYSRLQVVGAELARAQDDASVSVAAAREAATGFARLRLAVARRLDTADPDQQLRVGSEIAATRLSLTDRLGIVAARAQSVRAAQAAVHAEEAAGAWYDKALGREGGDYGSVDLDRAAVVAETQFDTLAPITDADAAEARDRHLDRLASESRLVLVSAGAGLAILALVAWLIDRRRSRLVKHLIGFIETASAGRSETELARALREAGGQMPGPTSRLLEAFCQAAERKSALRNEPTYRLADAIEAARDGVILLDALGRPVFVNAAAAVWTSRGDVAASRDIERELRLDDGRHLMVSRSVITSGGVLAVYSDVSAYVQQRDELLARNQYLQTALDDMSQGLCVYDAKGRLAVVNRRYCEIYRLDAGSIRIGMTAPDVLAASIAAGNHPGLAISDLVEGIGRVFAFPEEGGFVQEVEGGRAIEIRGRPTADGGFVATYEDVTERWHAASRIAHMARHDALTGLPNRVLLAERIEGAITQAGPDSGFALLCLDLDHFKQVNDTLGHPVGDELLRAVANRLAGCLREIDTVARLGGDEFAIVQATAGRTVDAAILAERIIEVVGAPYQLAHHTVTVGVSIGIAIAPRDGMDADGLMKGADVALYRAKDDGRGTFRFFEAGMDVRLQTRRLLEIDLRAAVDAGDFELHYQPIYDLRRDRIVGFEALLRWRHPERGSVSPADFIPLAEEIGLIVPLGEWVLARACEEASHWPDDLKVAVNVSPAQFQSAQLIEAVRSSLARTGLPAARLELEITESVLLVNGSATIAILHALRTYGVGISMDDFGTGYSSLSYLRSFPFDKMKIDKSFIQDLGAGSDCGFIVKAMIGLGSSLGMTTTAEGVETEEQLARLRAEGCDEVQGYLFSPPVAPAQLPALLEKWNGRARAVA